MIEKNKLIISILLIAIFLLAFGIRANLLQYHNLFEYDAYFHARMTEDVVLYGHTLNPDPLAYYQIGGVPNPSFSTYYYISAGIYNLVSLGQPFNKELFTFTIQLMPCIFGAIICILMFFLIWKIFNSKKTGIAVAFVAAVMPAFVYRTMAGAQGDNAFGFLPMVLGLLFFILSLKNPGMNKRSIILSILAGLTFVFMALGWNMYLLIFYILLPYYALKVLLGKENNSFLINFFITFGIFCGGATLAGLPWLQTFGSYLGISNISISSAIIPLIILVPLIINYAIIKLKLEKYRPKIVLAIFIILLIVLVGIFALINDFGVDRSTVGSMVGEESIGHYFFLSKFNVLMIFPFMFLFSLPFIWYKFREDISPEIFLLFFWTFTTLIMAWYKLKFTFAYGLPHAIALGFFVWLFFFLIKKYDLKKNFEVKLIGLILLFFIICSVSAGAIFIVDYTPALDQNPGFVQELEWIKNNTPQDAKLFNWWNDGHILSYLAERRVSSDNRNASIEANQGFAKFLLDENIDKAYEIVNGFDSDYILLTFDDFLSIPSMAFYSNNRVDAKFASPYYESGPFNVVGCGLVDNISLNCGGNIIPLNQVKNIPSVWTSNISEFYNGSYPVYYYYSNNNLIILNRKINNTNLAKVWFHYPETEKYYKEVFSNWYGKIFKVIK